jgi:DNA-directed RNA polymerase subunit beta
VQKRSYERFLQMYTAPADREESGLQAVFKSVFPISDFRENCCLEFVEYSIGQWECKCGALAGIENLRTTCSGCGRRFIVPGVKSIEISCPECGNINRNAARACDECGDTVALKFKYDVAECQE